MIEGIYDKTIPPLFSEISAFEYEGKLVSHYQSKRMGKHTQLPMEDV